MPDTMIPEAADTEAPVWRETGRSAQLNELFAALAKAQGEIGGAKKDSTNPHFKSSYADLASVRDVTQEPLSKNGLAVVQWPRTVERGVEVETILGHSSGQYMSGVLWMPLSKMDAHGVGSAITYGRRYALMAVTGVAPVDDDGNAAAAPGMAASGGDFRPPGPRQSSANGRQLAAADPHLVDQNRAKGTVATKPAPGAKTPTAKAQEWTDKAIQTLNLTDHTVDSLSRFWSDNTDKIAWLEDNAADQHERFVTAYDNAATTARAKVQA